jgi:hypothetical protein
VLNNGGELEFAEVDRHGFPIPRGGLMERFIPGFLSLPRPEQSAQTCEWLADQLGKRKRKGRDKGIEARDKWIYDQCVKGTPYDEIIGDLKRRCNSNPEWGSAIESVQGIRSAASRYAERNGKTPIPRRQDL